MGLGSNAAYPFQHEWVDGTKTSSTMYGMTIRQRYAMAAMQGYTANGWIQVSIISEQAYRVADAMIAFEEGEYAKQQELGDKTT